MPLALAGPAQAATENIAIFTLQNLNPPTRQAGKRGQQPDAAACWKGMRSPGEANFQSDFQHRNGRSGEPKAAPDSVSDCHSYQG